MAEDAGLRTSRRATLKRLSSNTCALIFFTDTEAPMRCVAVLRLGCDCG